MRKALSVLCALLLLALPLGSLAECAHIWRDGAVLTEGTCVTQGERQIVCTKCGAQSTRAYYGPHCYTTWWDITPATCTSKGLRHYVCRNCGYEKTQPTRELAHNYGDWTTLAPASMYSLGLRGHTCQDCGAYEEAEYCADDALYQGVDNRDAVRDMQQKLKRLGLYKGSTDGGFGPRTEGAVRAFQQKHGLPDTGIADPETLDQLEAAWCEVKGYDQPTPKATYPAHCTLDTLADGTQQLRLCREHAQLTAKAWGLSDEETYSLWLEEWNRLYAQCVDGAEEDQRAAVAEARDWALLLIKGQRVVWQAKYDRQDVEVESRMARLIVDKCVELCRQMGSQQ